MTPTRYDTSLLIGATGMLARVLAEVAARSTRTVAVARHASHSLAAAPAEMGILPVDLDWRDTDAFVDGVVAATAGCRVDLVVLWMHGTGKAATDRLLDRYARTDCTIVHVLSSAAPDPAAFRAALPHPEGRPPRCRYLTVKLGAVTEDGRFRRWLTNDEIAGAVLSAIDEGRDIMAGTLPG
ncbi:hypothetical protein [Tistrella mobilis]|uniref:hypothetical protein n=1 Tax=Tistrella mobilis TaxID=171437 RepID=UPI003555F519